MQVFYAPDITGDSYILSEKESRHSVRVLRMTKGDTVKLVDGKGNLYEGEITEPDPGNCLIRITSVKRNFEKRNYRLHIAISPLKNPERFEWFVEKSVEIGIDEITPLICRRSEKPAIKADRTRNLIISAMKQSLKATITLLNDTCSFNDFIRSGHKGVLMIAHCNQDSPGKKITDIYTKGDDAVILIGPEGDFTGKEISSALDKGFKTVQLGSSRMRTETAGIAACHSVYFINQ